MPSSPALPPLGLGFWFDWEELLWVLVTLLYVHHSSGFVWEESLYAQVTLICMHYGSGV